MRNKSRNEMKFLESTIQKGINFWLIPFCDLETGLNTYRANIFAIS